MNTHNLAKLLHKNGLDALAAMSVAKQITTRKERAPTRKLDKDWNALLEAPRKTLRTLQSSAQRWGNDPLKADLYKSYTILLQMVIKRITSAATVALAKGQTIHEAAKERGLVRFDGLKWYSWIPDAIYAEFTAAFAHLHVAQTARNPRERKRDPWHTATDKSANERRWEILTAKIVNLRARYPDIHGKHAQIHLYLNHALAKANQRTALTLAPVQWTHLLDKSQQEAYAQWKEATLDGLKEAAEE